MNDEYNNPSHESNGGIRIGPQQSGQSAKKHRFGAGAPNGGPAETGETTGEFAVKRRLEEIMKRESTLREAEQTLAERERFVEKSEQKLREKNRALQEKEASLEQNSAAGRTRSRPRETGPGSGAQNGCAPADSREPGELRMLELLQDLQSELEQCERRIAERESSLQRRREALFTNEALLRARQRYVDERESILIRGARESGEK